MFNVVITTEQPIDQRSVTEIEHSEEQEHHDDDYVQENRQCGIEHDNTEEQNATDAHMVDIDEGLDYAFKLFDGY